MNIDAILGLAAILLAVMAVPAVLVAAFTSEAHSWHKPATDFALGWLVAFAILILTCALFAPDSTIPVLG